MTSGSTALAQPSHSFMVVDGLLLLLLITMRMAQDRNQILGSPRLGGKNEVTHGEQLGRYHFLALCSVGGQRSKRVEWAEVVKGGFLEEETLRA